MKSISDRLLTFPLTAVILLLVIGYVSTLTVSTASGAQTPRITTQPASSTVYTNEVVTLTVSADVADDGSITYQWYSNSRDSNVDGTLISGATRTSFTPPTDREGTVFYYAIVTNSRDGATSSIATITARVTVNARINAQTPIITAQPTGGAVSIDGAIMLSVTAQITDGGILSYQWFTNDNNSSTGGVAMSGATSASFIPPTSIAGEAYYYVVVTNTNSNASGQTTGTAISASVRVTVNALVNALIPNITAQPENSDVIVGGSVELSVAASVEDEGVLTFQWYENTMKSNIDGTQIAGAVGTSFFPPTNIIGERFYYVAVVSTNNNATGEIAAMAISEAISVTTYTIPGAPRELIAIPSGNQMLISWIPPQEDGYSNIIRYELSNDNGVNWLETSRDNRYLFTELTAGATYTFWVRAVNAAGYGESAMIIARTGESTVEVSGVSLSPDLLSMRIGESTLLRVIVSPADAENQSVTWLSSNAAVAAVDTDGVVTAISEGFATITVTTVDGNYEANCAVTVEGDGVSVGILLAWITAGAFIALVVTVIVYSLRKKRFSR